MTLRALVSPLPDAAWSVIAVRRFVDGEAFENRECPMILGVDGVWYGGGFTKAADQIAEWRLVDLTPPAGQGG